MTSIKCITLEEELKKNPELKLSDIQILREWCEKQPHLPKIQDVELAIFLYCNYYYIERTKNMIENYYTYRTHVPELFSNRNVLKMKQLRDAFKIGTHLVLEHEEYGIMILRLVDMDPSHFVHNELIKAQIMSYDEFLWTRGLKKRYMWIFDAMGFTMGHMTRCNLPSLKKMMYYIQNAAPVRTLEVHIINTSSIVEQIFNMIKPFMNEEMINSVHFHTSLQSINKYIPIEILPDEFGGKAGPIKELMDAHLKRIENFHEWFLEDEKNHRVNESLRIGNNKTSSDLFGVDGTFKQID
ncbi:PREDICTED: alpha-tocopherol transfer protein-like [Dinoponera quadriceps]|uniref:Alpha-tocopherol transfer protein-like n=1 Tax=Dinoponera quadriceps TaxID=609295 RepID=A0A6P3XZP8_DINQU|nr:PREDICTED: alpha-tocopherol transfer protein-like [Dinoponera quadriceps]